MKTLDQICLHHQTDKASQHEYKGHNYAQFYEQVFGHLRNTEIRLLEVGVGGAQSIKSWLEFFPKALVHGVDLVNGTNPWNTVGEKPHPRYRFATGDQGSAEFWKNFVLDYGGDFDIFIDDGSHFNHHVIPCFDSMWRHIRRGGFYAVEDLEVAYSAGSIFLTPGWPHHMDWVKTKLDAMHLSGDFAGAYLMKGLAIFQKA